jgi:hypothetical protein
MKQTAFLLSLTLLGGCSSEQIYNAGVQMEQSRCARQPANVYQECLVHSDMSYAEYSNLRKNPGQKSP